MTETEQKLIDDLRPRLDNWRRAYRDRVVKKRLDCLRSRESPRIDEK